MSMYPLLVLFIYSVAMLSFCRITCYSAEQERRAIGRLFCMCRPRHNRTPEQGQEGDGVGGGTRGARPRHFRDTAALSSTSLLTVYGSH